jgi:hypothetical protein
MSDRVTLVLPAEEEFRPIAHLVVGGLAARFDLTLDVLDDIQVGLDALLARRDDRGEVVLTVQVDDRVVRATVGPFPPTGLDDLERDGPELGLRRVLETVCDTFEVDERDGGAWVELTKRTAEPASAGG